MPSTLTVPLFPAVSKYPASGMFPSPGAAPGVSVPSLVYESEVDATEAINSDALDAPVVPLKMLTVEAPFIPVVMGASCGSVMSVPCDPFRFTLLVGAALVWQLGTTPLVPATTPGVHGAEPTYCVKKKYVPAARVPLPDTAAVAIGPFSLNG